MARKTVIFGAFIAGWVLGVTVTTEYRRTNR